MKKVDVTKWFDKRDLCYDYTNTVFVADWNKVPKAMYNYLNNFYDLVYEDEGHRCSHCYEWFYNQDLLSLECDLICKDCAKENPEWVIDEYKFFITDLPVYPQAAPNYLKKAVDKAGFVPLHTVDSMCKDEFENGFYRGMNETPQKVVELAREHLGDNWEGLFMIEYSTPFMVRFSLYLKKLEV